MTSCEQQQLQSLLQCLTNNESIKEQTLRKCLKSVSVEERYYFLQNVRGEIWWTKGQTALHGAAMKGYKNSVESLLQGLTPKQKYAILNVQNSRGRTALHCVAAKGHTDTARALLKSLTPEHRLTLLKVQDIWGRTALHWAADTGQTDTVGVILGSMSPEQQLSLLKVQDKRCSTTLHMAAAEGHTDTVKVLLSGLTAEHQLSLVDMQDKAGRTTCDEAIKNHPETAACLKQIRDAANEATNSLEVASRGQRNPEPQENLDEKNLEGAAGNSAVSTDELNRELDIGKTPENGSTSTTDKDTNNVSSLFLEKTTSERDTPEDKVVSSLTVTASASDNVTHHKYTFNTVFDRELTLGPTLVRDIANTVRYLTVFTNLTKTAMARKILLDEQYLQNMLRRSWNDLKSYLANRDWKARLLLIKIAKCLPSNYRDKFNKTTTSPDDLIASLPPFISKDESHLLLNEHVVPRSQLQMLISVLQNPKQLDSFVLHMVFESRLEARDAQSEIFRYLAKDLGLEDVRQEIFRIIQQRNSLAKGAGRFDSAIERYRFFVDVFRILTEINWKFLNPTATPEQIEAKLAELIGASGEEVTMVEEISEYEKSVLMARIQSLKEKLGLESQIDLECWPTDDYRGSMQEAETKAAKSDPTHRHIYLTPKSNDLMRKHIQYLAELAERPEFHGVPKWEDLNPNVELLQKMENDYKKGVSQRTEEEESGFGDEGEDARGREDDIPESLSPALLSSYEKPDGAQADFFRSPTLSSNPSLPIENQQQLIVQLLEKNKVLLAELVELKAASATDNSLLDIKDQQDELRTEKIRTEEKELGFEDEDEGENARDSDYEIPASLSSFQKPDGAQDDFFCSPTLSSNPSLPMPKELDTITKLEISSTKTTNKDTRLSDPQPPENIDEKNLEGGAGNSAFCTDELHRELDIGEIPENSSTRTTKEARRSKVGNPVPPESLDYKSSTQPGGSCFQALDVGVLPQPAARLDEDKLGKANRDADAAQIPLDAVHLDILRVHNGDVGTGNSGEEIPTVIPMRDLERKSVLSEPCISQADYSKLVDTIYEISEKAGIPLPVIMENSGKILVHGHGISIIHSKLRNLSEQSGYEIEEKDISPAYISPNGIPVYTERLVQKEGPWYIYIKEKSLPDPSTFTMGLFVTDDARNCFGVTAGHAFTPDHDAKKIFSDMELKSISAETTSFIKSEKLSVSTKAQNNAGFEASDEVLISYKYQAKKPVTQEMMHDIALIKLNLDDIKHWLIREEGAEGPPLHLHYGSHRKNEKPHLSSREHELYCSPFKQSVIAGILCIENQSHINMLADHKVNVFIGCRGDLIGTVRREKLTIPNMKICIFFNANRALMPGSSGSSVMVLNTLTEEFYVIGIVHGKIKGNILGDHKEIYIATSLSASFKEVKNLYPHPKISGDLKVLREKAEPPVSGFDGRGTPYENAIVFKSLDNNLLKSLSCEAKPETPMQCD